MTVCVATNCVRKCSVKIPAAAITYSGVHPVQFLGSGNTGQAGVNRLPDEYFTLAQSDGQDICAYSDSGLTAQLAIEIVPGSYNAAAKTVEVWVSPTMANGVDCYVYFCYQSTGGTLTQPAAGAAFGSQAVWDANEKLRMHDPYTAADSTQYGNNGSNGGATSATCKIGGGAAIDGNYAHAITTPTLIPAGTYTHYFSAWIKTNDKTVSRVIIDGRVVNAAGGHEGLVLYLDANGYLNAYTYSPDATGIVGSVNLADNNWHLVVAQYTGSHLEIYADGASAATPQTRTFNVYTANSTCVIGGAYVTGNTWLGNLDEMRVGNLNRSSAYIATDYAVQTSTGFVVGTPANIASSFQAFWARRPQQIIGMAA